jgi:hypothetical protein
MHMLDIGCALLLRVAAVNLRSQERTSGELAKQKAMTKKTQKQRQEDLCENLGRGC